jgi:hypothetical protein
LTPLIPLIPPKQKRPIFVDEKYLTSFPNHPVHEWDEDQVTDFGYQTDDEDTDFDPSKTNLLEIVFCVRCPYLEDPSGRSPDSKTAFTVRLNESEPIKAAVYSGTLNMPPIPDRDIRDIPMERLAAWNLNAKKHVNSASSKIVLFTRSARLYVIPPDTLVKDLWGGVKTPRDGPHPFEDLQKMPRRRAYEPDGMSFTWGCQVNLFLVPNEKVTDLYGLTRSSPNAC